MEYQNNCLTESAIIKDALEKLDVCEINIVIVLDEENKLLGVVTDGDIRRGFLRGVNTDDSILEVMNKNPHVFPSDIDRKTMLELMRTEHITQAILVDDGRIVSIESISSLIQPHKHDNWVVIMAGGLGTRLHPMTKECPKPLLEVAGKPVIEWIIEKFIGQGFNRFYISVNYLSEKIMTYLGDGSKYNSEIRYIHEDKKMGTAGALGLISEKPKGPMVVMNGDILTTLDFDDLLRFHFEHNSDATMVVRESETQLAYGVVYANEHQFTEIIEKPIERHMISAGIYVINPSILEYLDGDSYTDMPDFFNFIAEKEHNATIFPIREYWIDIGRIDDLDQAKREFEMFS